MSRRRHKNQHPADVPGWSATKQARQLIELRDLVVARGHNHPVVLALAAEDLKKSLGLFIERGRQNGAVDPVADAIDYSGHRDLYQLGLSDPAIYQSAVNAWDRTLSNIERAEPHIISPEMHAATIAAAYTLTDDDALRIHAADLPTESGVLMFPQHMIVEPPGNLVAQDLIAIAWNIDNTSVGDTSVPTLRIQSWLDTHGPVQVENFTTMEKFASESGHPLPPWTLLGDAGQSLADDLESSDLEFLSEAERRMIGASALAASSLRSDSMEVEAEYDSSSAITGHEVHPWVRKYLFAFFRLADQQIATINRYSDGLPATSRHQPHYDTRIVQLRRSPSRAGGEATDSGRRYTQRFVVRMHRQNQWYPSLGRHKIIWRGPYIKGPEGAPMMKGHRVNALTR